VARRRYTPIGKAPARVGGAPHRIVSSMLRVYVEYWRINVLTLLEYRANFIMWFVFTIVYHGVALGALYVTMRQFPSMNGWNFREMFFLYALWMAGHELHNTLFFTVVSVPEYVREGRFDRFLVRPLDTLFQVLTVPQQSFPDALILGIATLAAATVAANVRVDWIFLVFVPLVVAGGALIDLGISLVVATCSFWFIRVDTLRWVVMSLEQDFTRYPISIYSRGVRIVLAFVLPFAFMNYFPATYFLQKADTGLHLNPAVGLLTPAIGLAWLGAAYAFWLVGLRHYQGTGS
jgi:ABC-2 type transport system permease protein